MKKSVLALALCASLALTGCGDDSATKDDAPPALTKAEFVEQANASCAKGEEALDEAFHELGDSPTQAQLLDLVDGTGVDLMTTSLEELRALVPPADVAGDVEAMLDSLEASIDQVDEDPTVIFTDDSLFADADAHALALGLDDCA